MDLATLALIPTARRAALAEPQEVSVATIHLIHMALQDKPAVLRAAMVETTLPTPTAPQTQLQEVPQAALVVMIPQTPMAPRDEPEALQALQVATEATIHPTPTDRQTQTQALEATATILLPETTTPTTAVIRRTIPLPASY